LTSAPNLINNLTSDADLYAAIPAEIPKRIFLPLKTVDYKNNIFKTFFVFNLEEN